jgi:tetratricopeptide (TPR) repeat protein
MARCTAALCLAASAALFAQTQTQTPPEKSGGQLEKQRPQPKTSDKEEVPPEEDAGVARTEYTFNPLEAKKCVQIGDFYFHTKHDYRAAANRYRDATKYNDGEADAWLKLGIAEEKLKDPKAAKEAYSKYLELASDAKNAAEIRKKLEKLK